MTEHSNAHPYHAVPSSARVVEILRSRGYAAEYEYPGYVSLQVGDGTRVITTGTANPTWTIDLQSADGEQNLDGDDTGILVTDSGEEAYAVADALIAWARANGHIE